ncbi:MAG TPA: glycosyltransferase [Nitrospira sp.]|nr:glycosyltransferase [Nitrospira sp.]
MKFLIANTDYAAFLTELYARHPGLSERSYGEQLRFRYATRFGVADFYSRNLRALGHEAQDVYVNNLPMQRAWAKEYGPGMSSETVFGGWLDRLWQATDRPIMRRIRPLIRPWCGRDDEAYRTLTAQVEHHRPDVFLNQAMDGIESRWVQKMRPCVRLIVGQHAATSLPDDGDYRGYDLVISSFPPTVEFFQRKGIPAVLHRLGFDPEVLPPQGNSPRTYPVTFVGSLFTIHKSRIEWLEQLCALVPELKIWGPGVELLDASSPLRRRHMGVVWGSEMYEVLLRSQITLNHHGDVAPYANNCRLFEATGAGAMLLTDWKANLQDLFDVGREVAAYRTAEECAEMIRHYLTHEEARQSMARAGQARTLRDHTYRIRMQELIDIVHKRMVA